MEQFIILDEFINWAVNIEMYSWIYTSKQLTSTLYVSYDPGNDRLIFKYGGIIAIQIKYPKYKIIKIVSFDYQGNVTKEEKYIPNIPELIKIFKEITIKFANELKLKKENYEYSRTI